MSLEIRLFNTLSRSKEKFTLSDKDWVGFYVCGPTVYDYIHIGNARVFVVFDSLRRFLREVGYKVVFVQNFTDVDDKIINKANQLKVSFMEVADRFINEYWKDADALGIQRGDYHPRATEHIDEIINLIRILEEKGFTYLVEGDVLFDVSRFPEYGKLSGKKLDELIEGARVEARYRKRNPADFVLWKAAKPGEPFWESPWGRGRPGWHIECSAMSMKYLGPTLDIHAGGADLVFPHHENEIAQSEAATGKPFARYFLHNGYLTIGSQKMSKSLGNIIKVRDLLKVHSPQVLRIALFGAHYRSPLSMDDTTLDNARGFLNRIKNFLRNFFFIKRNEYRITQEENREVLLRVEDFKIRFFNALADDFNTPQALGTIGEFVRFANEYLHPSRKKWDVGVLNSMEAFLQSVDRILGIIPLNLMDEEDREVIELVSKREEARKEKKWQEADAIRAVLKEKGFVLEDTPLGTRWYRVDESAPEEP
ncbi:MAG: cysteinyl-tRNA synthetase [Candidatus Atribacteria bacterium]|jgi:cysteinyl-tRNA synthetase|nr:cysteinyl-tRNA synthetase [Candidatus Atribacteria bacterium]MDI3530686.1 cysteinyl-tRNA synthetase [Candidatus Atribacteria bacterium]